MSRLRVLLVGRHFWPHGSHDSAGDLVRLAVGLSRRGVQVEIATPRFGGSWPESIRLREIPVHRPLAAPRSEWSMGRYLRQLTHWIRERAVSYDILMADAIREESMAVVQAGRGADRPTVLRLFGFGQASDAAWWPHSRGSRRVLSFARAADRVVVPSAASQRLLLGQGFAPQRVVRIEPGFCPGSPRSESGRAAARETLGAINLDLACSPTTPVAVAIGRLRYGTGMARIAETAASLIRRFPDLRLWFIGDGSDRDSLYTELNAEGLRGAFAMPGSFVELQDVLAAADLFLQPDHYGLSHFMPAAVSAALPLVIPDDEFTRAALGVPRGSSLDPRVGWCADGSPKALRVAVRETLDDLSKRRRDAAELRKALVRERSLGDTLDAYLRLFRDLVSGHRSPPSSAAEGAPS